MDRVRACRPCVWVPICAVAVLLHNVATKGTHQSHIKRNTAQTLPSAFQPKIVYLLWCCAVGFPLSGQSRWYLLLVLMLRFGNRPCVLNSSPVLGCMHGISAPRLAPPRTASPTAPRFIPVLRARQLSPHQPLPCSLALHLRLSEHTTLSGYVYHDTPVCQRKHCNWTRLQTMQP